MDGKDFNKLTTEYTEKYLKDPETFKDHLEDFYSYCKNLKLDVVGLMCIPPANDDPGRNDNHTTPVISYKIGNTYHNLYAGDKRLSQADPKRMTKDQGFSNVKVWKNPTGYKAKGGR